MAQLNPSSQGDADEALRTFDLSTGVLHDDVIGRAVRNVRGVDPLSPRGAAGRRMHDECVAGLRNHLVPQGWIVREEDGVARTVNTERSLAIVCAGGNEFTGLRAHGSSVTTAWPKGDAAFAHAHMDEPEGLESVNGDDFGRFVRRRSAEWRLWYLLYRQEGGEFRIELSAPTYRDSAGFFRGWAPRILVDPYTDEGGFDLDVHSDPDPAPDVPVFEL